MVLLQCDQFYEYSCGDATCIPKDEVCDWKVSFNLLARVTLLHTKSGTIIDQWINTFVQFTLVVVKNKTIMFDISFAFSSMIVLMVRMNLHALNRKGTLTTTTKSFHQYRQMETCWK